MFCTKCGSKIADGAKFCTSCGKGIQSASSDKNSTTITTPVSGSMATIKCGNCGYEGHGEKARNIAFVILAWLCVLFAPLITIIYFLATAKWRCPKCQSTFLGVKNNDGKFIGQRSGNGATIVVIVIVAIVVIGILASVVLASLNSARMKGRDARRIADVKQLQLGLELYYDAKQTYPKSLQPLAQSYIDTIPDDPTGNPYTYSYCSPGSYHLGASLEQQDHAALANDADNVSMCLADTINGKDAEKCTGSDSGSYCFDVTPSAGGVGSLENTTGDMVEGQDIVVGTGAKAVPGSEVSVLYVGKLEDGTIFDSSAAHGNAPLTLTLGDQGIIPGFQIGLNGMRVGGERVISIPPSLGYGVEGVTDSDGNLAVPPNATLIFNIKLTKVSRI